MLGHEKQTVLEQADADVGSLVLSLAAAALLVERGQNRDRAEHAAHDVVGGGADALRLFLRAGHGGEARHHLHDFVERRAMLVGPGQEALVSADDQIRIFAAQFAGAKALLFQLPVAEILQEHIGAFEQPMHDLAVVRLCEVEHDAALAAVEQREERGSHAAQAAGLVAGRRFDLDDLGPKLRQDHAAGRPHHHVGHLDDLDPRQRQVMRAHWRLPRIPWNLYGKAN